MSREMLVGIGASMARSGFDCKTHVQGVKGLHRQGMARTLPCVFAPRRATRRTPGVARTDWVAGAR